MEHNLIIAVGLVGVHSMVQLAQKVLTVFSSFKIQKMEVDHGLMLVVLKQRDIPYA